MAWRMVVWPELRELLFDMELIRLVNDVDVVRVAADVDCCDCVWPGSCDTNSSINNSINKKNKKKS